MVLCLLLPLAILRLLPGDGLFLGGGWFWLTLLLTWLLLWMVLGGAARLCQSVHLRSVLALHANTCGITTILASDEQPLRPPHSLRFG